MALRTLASQCAVALNMRVAPAPYLLLRTAAARAYATNVPDDLKYAASHEWVKVSGDSATVGISEFAQSELGDVVYVELPEVGATVTKGETFGVVESVKAASDVYSPVSGEVVEVNTELEGSPGLVNSSAFKDGWMMKVTLSDKAEVDTLLNPEAYAKSIEDN
eukprot:CAMPEP_0118956392 /NCGR_PEP_ID=MMETSP1169-20130426/61552_1 /TAXON_ID=36882 /ORGANISM="Pyramimonas obovata, Strain CCMP722" /LENGTH=162 /DNA_ID=CAMNT_0006904419 /DNA_START=829 /DNA_END=1317 /DNA_ORIENTATION=-